MQRGRRSTEGDVAAPRRAGLALLCAVLLFGCEPRTRHRALTILVDGVPLYEAWLNPPPEERRRRPPQQVHYQQPAAIAKIVAQPRLAVDFGERPAIEKLADWQAVLAALPKATYPKARNVVDWNAALDQGIIQPLSSLGKGELPLEPLESEVRLKGKEGVVFRHVFHTRWLACESCHDAIFPREAGKTEMTMDELLDGKYCGVCHGRGNVAFDMKVCVACHPRGEQTG